MALRLKVILTDLKFIITSLFRISLANIIKISKLRATTYKYFSFFYKLKKLT